MDTPEQYSSDLQLLVQQITLHDTQQHQRILQQLSGLITYFIEHDFERLIRLLYTIDVDEKKLKQALHQQEKDAALIIAEMIVQRQLQKLITRQQMTNHSANISEEEKW